MKITIGGTHGSGKSTVAKAIAERLSYKHYSAGILMRELALKRGVSLMDFIKIAERDPSINKETDERTRRIGKAEDNFVFDGHMAYHFIPDSIKVFLRVELDIAARRIWADLQAGRRVSEEATSLDELKGLLRARAASEQKQYKAQYNADVFDERNFDFVLDTTGLTIEESVQKVVDFVLHKR
jgi:cytidylate kinase